MAYAGFCKIEGIDGESTDDKHAGQVEILSYKHKMTQSGGGAASRAGGGTGARVDISDFVVTKLLDKATPNLAKYCASGKHIPSVIVELCSASEEAHTYMKYTLSDVVVSFVEPGGESDDDGSRPSESVGFRFAKIEWEYTPFDNKGKAAAAVKAGWDASTNKAS